MHCLFIGLGGVGQRHLRNVRELYGADARISAYRVRGEKRVIGDKLDVVGSDVAERYDVEVFENLDAALRGRPDAVFVTNPTSEHVRAAQRSAEAGCHLFVEKPLSHDLDGVDELIRTVDGTGAVAFVAYQLRQHPGFRSLSRWVSDRVAGEVLAVHAEVGEYLPGFHPYEDYRRMYASRRDLGGGVTVTQIHELDYLYALFGLPKRVFSLGGRVSDLEIDVEDLSSSLLEYRRPGGQVMPVHVHQDYFQRPKRRGCRLVCQRGVLEWNLSAQELSWVDVDGSLLEHRSFSSLERNQMFLDELSHFFSCIDSGERPEVTLRDGRASLRMALAILESQRTGQPIELASELADEAAA